MKIDDWEVLVSFLPDNWEDLARSTGALKGLRKDKDAAKFLRVLMIHLACGHSLRETAVRAREAQLADMSDVALLKRLRKSKPWLQALCEGLFAERGIDPSELAADLKMRIFDGTTVKEPGRTGRLWRVHFSMELPSLQCDYFKVTDSKGKGNGEGFAQYPISAGDLILADAGFATPKGVRHIHECGAFATVRINPMGVRLENPDGSAFDLIREMKGSLPKSGQTKSWAIRFCGQDGKGTAGRLCVVRKSEAATRRALKRIKRKAQHRGASPAPDALIHARYIILFTTFPESRFPLESVLEYYRIRWQIELVFKRFKQLAQIGHLPKYEEESSKAWLYGKLLVALLVQKIKEYAESVSPWGCALQIRPRTKQLA
jgi:hypothetical protein